MDMDGVLVEYRKDDKVYLTYEELVEEGSFLHRNPVPVIVKAFKFLVENFNIDVHVLSVSPNEKTDEEKLTWLGNHLRNYVFKDNVHFVRKTIEKVDYMNELYYALKEDHDKVYGTKLKRSDVIVVDDTHEVLYAMEDKGFTAWHPTSLLNFYFLGTQQEKNVLSTKGTV